MGYKECNFASNLWVGAWMRDDILLSSAVKRGFVEKDQIHVFTERLKNREYEQAFFRKQTIDALLNKPFYVLYNWLYRVPKMWIGTRTDLFTMRFQTGSIFWYASKVSYFGINFIMVALMVILLTIGVMKRDAESYLFATFVLYLLLIYMPFYNIETRYSQPVLGSMILYLGISSRIFINLLASVKSKI